MVMAPRFKYFNPNDPSATVAVAGADPDPKAVFLSLPVIADKSEEMDKCRVALDTAKAEETVKKVAADQAWAKALEAQRAAKRAEFKADQTGAAADIKVSPRQPKPVDVLSGEPGQLMRSELFCHRLRATWRARRWTRRRRVRV